MGEWSRGGSEVGVGTGELARSRRWATGAARCVLDDACDEASNASEVPERPWSDAELLLREEVAVHNG